VKVGGLVLNRYGSLHSKGPKPVMLSETVGLRTRLVSDKKNRSWSWSCRSGVVL